MLILLLVISEVKNIDSFDNFHFSEKTFSNSFYMILYKFVDNTNDKDLNII